MDSEKLQNIAYEYLCHLEEAKIWMESVLKEPLPPAVTLEENLRNGVYLAKLAHFIAPENVPLSRIYDIFQHRYRSGGLQFRHTDNINHWIGALKAIGFPQSFIVETTDVYDKKNMPKVIYCIHALSAHLFCTGQAPHIQDLYGKAQFSEQDIACVSQEIKQSGMMIPSFKKINGLLAEQCACDMAALHANLLRLNKAIDDESEELLLNALTVYPVGLVQVVQKNISHYLSAFKMAKAEKEKTAYNRSLSKSYEPDVWDVLLSQSEIQGHIREVNIDCLWHELVKLLDEGNGDDLRKLVISSFSQFKEFKKQNIAFYIEEVFSLDLDSTKSTSTRDIIQGIIRSGNRSANEFHRISDAVDKVKQAVLSKNKEKLLRALRAPSLKLASQVLDFAASLYLEEMQEDFKMSENITYKDIKCSVYVLNGIAKLTPAVDGRDFNATWRLLSDPALPFMNVDSTLKTQYMEALYARRQRKLSDDLENSLLTFIDVQECIDFANRQESELMLAVNNLEKINESVRKSDADELFAGLQGIAPGVISRDDVPLCMILLKKRLVQKENNCDEAIWLEDVHSVVEETKICKQFATKVFEDFNNKSWGNRSTNDVLKSIENFGAETKRNWIHDAWYTHRLSEDITLFFHPGKKIYRWTRPLEHGETQVEGFNLMSIMKTSEKKENSPKLNGDYGQKIVTLQAVIRGFLVRQKFQKVLVSIKKIQKWWRHVRKLKEKTRLEPIDYYAQNVDKVIKIQAFWRGYQCRKALSFSPRRPRSPEDPSFQFLRHLALTRQLNRHDYSTDLRLQDMKSRVVKTIKMNQDLAQKLDDMDMKIGLLVQNRMSVEAIIAENKKLQSIRMTGNDSKGIKSFTKEGKRLLDGYQQLFYLLQTNPVYLTRLIVRLPSRLNHVIQSCVLSLFNYGSSSRDAYLLLRLFRSALFEEVQTKCTKPADAVTGNPLVLRLAVAYARQADGQNPLRNILGFLIEKVLNDKVFFDTNPVDIYRRWVNHVETETGKISNLPQTVTQEEALSYPEVVCRLNHNLRILKSWVKCFLEQLGRCVNQFPYPLRFIAKLLKNALLQKFPQTPEKDILKIVGNLVYYQYINSAIVAPDAFHTVSLPADRPMRVEQRRNLASIAKILHFAATKKGFGEESKYLMCLNPFIVECHKEMKRFCQKCCAVDDLEEHFHVTKYSEAALIDKPRTYITLEEMRECHKLLLEVRTEIAPDPMDPIHELLDDLGEPPSLSALVGCGDSTEGNFSRAGKMQVCLELDGKFLSPPEDPTEAEQLFIRTKELITCRLDELEGTTMSMAVRDPKHVDIATNLTELELAGLVKSSNDYQDMVKSILNDVLYEEERRRLQKQELNILAVAQRGLDEKRKFYQEQVSHYEEYLKTCLRNMTAPGKKIKEQKDKSLKYSGTRLREKGILITLDGVPPGQLKNVQFEISTSQRYGVYSVHGRFMGVEVEKIDVDIQDLLRLQFEGLREMDLFGKALINVNLLLHLLNKKFHARP